METETQFNREKNLFVQALEHPLGEVRLHFLNNACGNDLALFDRVQALLRAHEEAIGFLPKPGPNEAATVLIGNVTEKPGDRIGPYKLLQQIGEGGCGVVYMAEQEEPVRRRVALKVIKLGMDTKQVVARFEAERQALALMDHPNIAKVLEAGSTDTGRPYFVMELVRGIKITEFCDQKKLSTRERLDLFMQVCSAIQHAHQKGVIHRDLKPSNLLVTVNDGAAVPKVIDFGIAKATNQQRLTDKTLFTSFEQFIGTPAYMSPEQAEMTSLDIDTRSDIYSLGVVLYELLTGRTPFDAEKLMQSGMEGIRRTLREDEPPKPSTRISTLAAMDLTTVAKLRQMEPGKFSSSLRGDLDWVVMKCLEKDRARRYDTANGLVLDLKRYLGNEPVLARPPSTAYLLQKLIRRHKLAFAAGGAVMAALIVGLSFSSYSLVQEKIALRRAQAAEQKANAAASENQKVADFLTDMLRSVRSSVDLGRDTALLREMLDQTASRVEKELEGLPKVAAELRHILGSIYLELGDYAKAEEMHRAALTARRRLFGEEHEAVADSYTGLGNALDKQGDLAGAESMQRQALAIRRKLFGPNHIAVAWSLNDLAGVIKDRGKLDAAEAMHREAQAIGRKVFGDEHPFIATSLQNLANVFNTRGESEKAETLYRESLSLKRKVLGSDHPSVANVLVDLGNALHKLKKLEEAEGAYREALTIQRKHLGNEHPYTIRTLYRVASLLQDRGDLAGAETLYRECIQTGIRRLGEENQTVANALNGLGQVRAKLGDFGEAKTLIRQALAIRKRVFGENHPAVGNSMYHLAEVAKESGDWKGAEELFREYLTFEKRRFPDDEARSAGAVILLVEVLQKQEKFTEAEPMLLAAVSAVERSEKVPTKNKREMFELAVRFYEAWDTAEPGSVKASQAVQWKKKLAADPASPSERHKN